MTVPVDLLLDTSKGYYDISLGSDGDIAGTYGLNTALIVSLLTDARASESEQADPLLRRGWWGDLFGDVGDEIGSKLWLSFNQPLSTLSKNYIINYTIASLNWLIADDLADSVTADAEIDYENDTVTLTINIYKDSSVIQRQFNVVGNI
jgi:phage gp46-like protein